VDKGTNNSEITEHLKEEMLPIKSRQNNDDHGAKVVSLPPENSDINIIIQAAKIDLSEKLNPPEVCLSICEGDKTFILYTLGNFSCLTGKAKSKKTFLVVIFIAAYVRDNVLFEKIKSGAPESKKLAIFFDTEQSRHKVQQAAFRICGTAEVINPDNLEIYSLRSYPPDKRLQIIEAIIYQRRDCLGYVVIDGVRDLVKDINNPEEATFITSKLLRWTEDLNIHITTVLHQNKGDNNARGHLGTEIINKAETVLSITKSTDNPDISIVEPEFCREIEFTPFGFSVDERGLPYLTDMPESKKEIKKVNTPFGMDRSAHLDLLKDVFSGGRQMKYKELLQAVKLSLQGLHGSCGENKAKDFLAHYKKQGWLQVEGSPGTRTAVYQFTGLM
jgi:hypothetical protein